MKARFRIGLTEAFLEEYTREKLGLQNQMESSFL